MLLSDTAAVSDSLSGSANYRVSGADASAISDFTTQVCHHILSVGDTLAVSDTATTRRHLGVGIADTTSLSDTASGHAVFLPPVSELVTVGDTVGVVYTSEANTPHKFHGANETVALSVATAIQRASTIRAFESVGLSEQLSVAAATLAVISSGTSLTVGFPRGLRLDGVSDTGRYCISAIDGGVPTMVLTATPIQGILASGSGGTIVGSGVTSNVFNTDGATIVEGNYLKVTGRWQVAMGLVVSVPDVGVAVLDTNLVVDDPDNGHLSWVLLSAVSGAALTIHEPSNNKTYRLTVSELLQVDGSPLSSSVIWSSTAPGAVIVAAEYFSENGNILLTFSEELSGSGFLSPGSYSISGPTSVEVTAVRTASPTQVVLSTTAFGTGTYTVSVTQP